MFIRNVAFHFWFFAKCFITKLTLIWLYLFMNRSNMEVKIKLPWKWFSTIRTLKWLFFFMNWCNMIFQMLFVSTGTNFLKIQIWNFFYQNIKKKIIHAQIIHEYELSSSFQPTISVPVEMTSKNIMGPVIITGSHANSHGK